MRAALIALALVAAPPTTGIHHTPAGVASAKRMLLRAQDVGAGWKTTAAAAKKVGELTCGNASPTVAGAVETGSAASPTYGAGVAGPFVTQEVFVYSTVAGAQRFWQHAVGKQTLPCVAKSITAGSTKDVTFKVTHSSTLPAPDGASSSAYRVVGQAVTQAQKVTVYVDVVLVRRGNAIAEVSFSSFTTPFSRGMELRIARVAAARI
jgi:hypothetical protein